VWLYNVLQHVANPALVLQNCLRWGKRLRLFEFLDIPTDVCHLHTLTEEFFRGFLGPGAQAELVLVDGVNQRIFCGVIEQEQGQSVPAVPKVTPPKPTHLTFHLPGLAHTVTNKRYTPCAFTQKVIKLAQMLMDHGHTVYHYGNPGAEVHCTEDVVVTRPQDFERDYSWDGQAPFHYDAQDAFHKVFYAACEAQIRARSQPGDIFCASWGWGHKPISDRLEDCGLLVVESGIGYPDTYAPYRVWESYAWMHHRYGAMQIKDGPDALVGDAVIPNAFDVDDFALGPKGDYVAYLGRLTGRKGVQLAADVTRDLGVPLKVAGQGALVNPNEGLHITPETHPNVEYVGTLGVEKRKVFLSAARCLLVPTRYVEPFGGVAVEAMLSGTPVLASDWGAFPETVQDGVSGFLCRTEEDFQQGIGRCYNLIPEECRGWAVSRYGMAVVGKQYDRYFRRLVG
jgi:glycosyltransferase involved in cell wall biosynthesis